MLPNRFYQVPHCTGFGTAKPGSQAMHRATKAEGGWGAVCTEYAPVSPDSDESPYISAQLLDEGDLAGLALMAAAAHAHGALAGIELTHTGAHAERRSTRWPAIAPSQLASDYQPFNVPKAMELDDIRRVQADWVQAAQRACSIGFDIVYVYGGHSYLLTQFLSSFTNKRTDGYGGSLESRARMWIETLELVKEAVGDVAAVAVRIGVDLTPGIDLDDALAFVRLADPFVDLGDVNVGSIALWSHDSGPSRFFAEGYQLEWTGRVREATSKPIVGVGRFTSPDRMAEVIRSGVLDLIGAHDPRSPTRSCRARSRRAATTRSGNALAPTSASPSPSRATTSAARRTRRPARSTAEADIRSASSVRRMQTATSSSSDRGRPAWSARSSSASAASGVSISSTRRRRSAE